LTSSINSSIIFVHLCLVNVFGRLRAKLAFFGWGGSTLNPYSLPYAEIYGFFSAKLLKQTY
jgi:hypothetical protein